MDNSFDRVLGKAIHDVAVPQGLADRILASLAEPKSVTESASCASVPTNLLVESAPTAVPLSNATNAAWIKRRRTWLISSAALATAACLLIGFGLWLGRASQQLSSEDVQDLAREFYNSDPDKPVKRKSVGQLFSKKMPPRGFPLAGDVVSNALTCWRYTKFLEQTCVAYDLFGAKDAQATLYVIQLDRIVQGPTIRSTASSPAAFPRTSSGLATSAWSVNDRLYVLVVAGNEKEYRQFLRPSGTLAKSAVNAGAPTLSF